MVATVADLSLHPLKFDGRLVVVRARLAFGWEGDNFLFDASSPSERNMASPNAASVWLYCKPGNECQPNRAIKGSERGIIGRYVGYFHFMRDQKPRRKDVFDPGPFQLEGIGVFDMSAFTNSTTKETVSTAKEQMKSTGLR